MIARLCALVAATAALALSTVVVAAPASADAIGACTATRGSIVAVDFSHWGGPIVRGCGVSSQSGFALLHDGGFTTAGDQHDGPAFVCRLGNGAFRGGTQFPTPDQDDCVVTPPASAYWSYWLAPRGQHTWSYSQLGAMSDVPKPGEVELWQFGGTDVGGTTGRPTVSPDALRATSTATAGTGSSAPAPHPITHTAPAPAPSSTTDRTRAARPPASSTNRPAGTANQTTPSGTGRTNPARVPSSSRARQGSTANRTATTTTSSSGKQSPVRATDSTQAHAATSAAPSGAPAIVDASPAAAKAAPGSTGSPTALIVGGGLAVVLAAGAGATMLRRRRLDPDA